MKKRTKELILATTFLIIMILVVIGGVIRVFSFYSPLRLCEAKNWTGNVSIYNENYVCEELKWLNTTTGGLNR